MEFTGLTVREGEKGKGSFLLRAGNLNKIRENLENKLGTNGFCN